MQKRTLEIIAALMAAFIVLSYFGYINLKTDQVLPGQPTPVPGGPYTGNLAITTQFLDHGNLDTKYDVANGTIKFFHADGTTLFGTTSVGAAVTGQVLSTDAGLLYMVVQPASTVYVDAGLTTSANAEWLGTCSPYVLSGVAYYKFPINVASLAAGTADDTREITLNVYLEVADVSGIGYVSSVNATSADYSAATWTTASASGYISGMTQKTAFKIARVQMSMPDAANITYLDNSKIKYLSVTLGLGNGQSWTLSQYDHYSGGTYIDFVTGSPDVTQEYYGKLVLYGSTDSVTDIDYAVNCQCSGFTAAYSWAPSLIITYIGPDGSTGTITRIVSFTDS